MAGLLVSALLMAAALGAVVLPNGVRHGLWLTVHLGLAGGAGTAIASVLPFFVVAVSVADPMGRVVRIGAIMLVAAGAVIASVGVVGAGPGIGVAGALTYLAGLLAVSVAAFWPLHATTARRHRLILVAYGASIAHVAIGVAIVTLMLVGFAPAVEHWGSLKPAHAWLNVFGFLSVTVAATLVHLGPTVTGGRIIPRTSATVALVALVAGPPLVALGFALEAGTVARVGVLIEGIGAVALVTHGLVVQRDRGRWTTDPGWHRLTSWSLLLAPWWFLVAVIVAGGRVILDGAVPEAWSLEQIAAPFAIGWVAQAMIGSWSHLLPAIGPASIAGHARQRALLGRAAIPRLVALELGVALMVSGNSVAWAGLSALGLTVSAASILSSLVILVDATLARAVDPDAASRQSRPTED